MNQETRQKEGSEGPQRARVLVIDDEPLLARTLVALLSDQHDAVAITQPLDALERLRAGERFDVILCDLLMPGMNGMRFFEALGALPGDLQRRVIFLTGGVQSAAMGAFLESTPNPCLDKPFSEETLFAAVAHLLASLA